MQTWRKPQFAVMALVALLASLLPWLVLSCTSPDCDLAARPVSSSVASADDQAARNRVATVVLAALSAPLADECTPGAPCCALVPVPSRGHAPADPFRSVSVQSLVEQSRDIACAEIPRAVLPHGPPLEFASPRAAGSFARVDCLPFSTCDITFSLAGRAPPLSV